MKIIRIEVPQLGGEIYINSDNIAWIKDYDENQVEIGFIHTVKGMSTIVIPGDHITILSQL